MSRHLTEDGVDRRFIQQQVGHECDSSTAVYTHVSDDFMNTALSRALAPAFAGAWRRRRTWMAARLDYRWHLRTVMAGRGMFSTTDLIPLLAERGITLSSSQVYRLVAERPERLSLKILMALLDILDCTMDDLIEPVAAAGAARPGKAAAGGTAAAAGVGAAAPEAGADHRGVAVTGSPGRPGPGDPAGALLAVMAELEPALSPEVVLGALGQAAARPDGRRRIAPAVAAQPGLLTGQGARAAFPGVLRFISALARAGAAAVVEPPCPRCGRQRPLGVPVEGLRLCGGCRSKARALRCGRCGKVRPPARLQRRRAAHLPELLAPGPAELETLRQVREQPACRRDHRGRAGLPELPPGSRCFLQHLRVSRQRPDRHLAGDRHPGVRAVPQALDHLLALRHRGAAEGRHAARAVVRALPQPRPGLLETVRVLPADLAAVDRGVHALFPGPETEADPHPARRHRRAGAGPAARGPRPASTVPTSCWTG